MKPLIILAAVIAALITVLSTRLLIPALEIIYYSILQTFEPEEPSLVPAVATVSSAPVVVTPVAKKPAATKTTATKAKATSTRTTRKRSAKPKTMEVTA